MSRILICASLIVAAACSTPPRRFQLIKVVHEESVYDRDPDSEAPMEERVYTWKAEADAAVQSPVQAIKAFVAPGSWDDEGTIQLSEDRLTVRHRPAVHAQIERLLKSLREDSAEIATFDVRFLRVDREELSEFQAFRAAEGSGAYAVVNRWDFERRFHRQPLAIMRHPVLACLIGQKGRLTISSGGRWYVSGVEVEDDGDLVATEGNGGTQIALEVMAVPDGDAGMRTHIGLAFEEMTSKTRINVSGGKRVVDIPYIDTRRLSTKVTLTEETCAVILCHLPGNTESLMMAVVRCNRNVID